MNNEQIIRKSADKIELVLKNKYGVCILAETMRQYASQLSEVDEMGNPKFSEEDWWETFAPIIFSHDFAKAFFGIEKVCATHGTSKTIPTPCHHSWEGGLFIPAWQYHLQQLSLAEDRMKYLSKFL